MVLVTHQQAVDALRSRLALNLRRLRSHAGLAQERLALEAGVDRTMLSKIERRVANPSLETLIKLSRRLGVDVVELLIAHDGERMTPAGLERDGPQPRPNGHPGDHADDQPGVV